VNTFEFLRCIWGEFPHSFGPWSYSRDGSCNRWRTCRNCSKVQKDTQHEFEFKGQGLFKCGRCGMEKQGIPWL
jgi:hypothetical protein